MAMAGLIFVLHFGVFKLLSASWRAKRVDAPPLMDFPLAARSLGEFWGRRWNTGFSVPARRLLFEPMRRKAGPALALLLVFLVSGIVHELAISVPARGGYGLPTLYFLFQAAAILLERSALGKRLRVGEGIRGRVFALVCAAAPAFWLFHPPFVERVILPFLHAIHSLRGALL
jgi:D-alanyl-lipoteichoic acid acyltransferase DltB (MBOAT superfamily)